MHYLFKNLILFVKPILWLAVIAVLSLMPGEDLPEIPLMQLPHFDKMVHIGMYFMLALLLVKPVRTLRLPVWPVILLIVALIGGMIEILQFAAAQYRSASWLDFFANLAGAAAGLLTFVKLVSGKWLERYL